MTSFTERRPATPRPPLAVLIGALAAAAGCSDGARASTADAGAAPPCSQLHRDLGRWQGDTGAACGPDLSGTLELNALGNGRLLARRRFGAWDDLWQLSPDGAVRAGSQPTPVAQVRSPSSVAYTLLRGTPPRVLVYAPRTSSLTVFDVESAVTAHAPVLVAEQPGIWGNASWHSSSGAPFGHQFIGLHDGYVLDRDLGDGATRVWRFVPGPGGPFDLRAPADLQPPPRESFRRGHRVVPLDRGRLLEWTPQPCASPAGDCPGATFNVWTYTLDDTAGPRVTFAGAPASSGTWPDVGAGDDLLSDDQHLYRWSRATGTLRAFALDPSAHDPLATPSIASPPDARLASVDWDPPTESPALKHLVFVLLDGRSFDSYFGQYCRGARLQGGAPLDCVDGPACCDAMPDSVPGAPACAPLASAPAGRHPIDTPACMRAKINGGAMDGFAITAPGQPACGDALDFACAGAGDAAGDVGIYHRLAGDGALADRFFQTYAFLDGETPASAPSAATQNLLYLSTSRYTAERLALFGAPLLTEQLAEVQVPWAIYAGRKGLPALAVFGVPIFHDPDWSPYRSLEGGELEHDIATGQLTSISLVLPDADDVERSDAPGMPIGPALRYVDRLLQTIEASRYRDDTLILVTYLTAAGYYDHVAPPRPPPLDVDSSGATLDGALPVGYGPRVPFLALGRFARRNHVSHVPLELSSVTLFEEWNWMRGTGLKGGRAVSDARRYRDTVVNNLGSLLDPAATVVTVPAGHY